MPPPSALSRWLTQEGVHLDPRIHLVSRPDGSTAVTSAAALISPGQTRKSFPSVARIPLSLVLSHRSSSLAQALDSPLEEDSLASYAPALRLAVHVAHELSLGSKSRWATYLEHCPARESVHIALLWQGEAQRWTRGTELERECARIGVDEAVLKRFYNHVALPLLSSLPSSSSASPPSFSTFLHAYVLVSSRAFQVSSYHPLALVPLADAFNHSDPPHAHLASDTWVCPECGRLGACPHDDDGGGPGHEERDEPLETVDMVSERKINPGEEVFNTYGAGLSNAHLVAAYGFLLEGNEHDVVSFGGREALQTMLRASDSAAVGDVDLDALEHALDSLGAAWRAAAASAPLLDEGHPLIAPLPSSPTPNLLGCFIDADARLSPELWLAVSLVAWLTARDDEAQRPAKRARSAAPPAVVVDASEALQDAVQLAELAEEAWRRCEEEAAADADGLGDADAGARDVAWPADEFEREALRCASALVRSVCAARIEEQVEEARGMDASALYERAEETADPSLRLAIEYLAGERLLLDRVSSQWTFS
ncbi:hypothetical protein DMC30DRAFT_413865 [Rhodotorula diobovata]|uniref:SET domain-containing protein n=1 Tax=Rhodotorula diobovata TaxID=5288 RepID=A0A5C5G3L8_9BASI|nr:hypothetical protein DMC30DRAFT_413865 [Rhodotorula diobovata]